MLSFADLVGRDSQQDDAAQAGTAITPAEERKIDLLAALQLAETQNPDIGISRQAIQEALAGQWQARSMLFPSLRAGGDYRQHEGVLQSSSGLMRDVNSSSLYLGNGAMTVAAGTTVIPGVQIFGHLGDGIFEPLAARQLVTARSFQAQATSNQVLLEVASRFLDLASAEAELQALQMSEQDMDLAVKITRDFTTAKQGRESDADRAKTTALLLHSQTVPRRRGAADRRGGAGPVAEPRSLGTAARHAAIRCLARAGRRRPRP